MRRRPRVFNFVSAPVETPALTIPISPPSLGSLAGNNVETEGASALAAVLKGTKITSLKCAAAPECSFLRQCPLTLSAPASASSAPVLAVSHLTASIPSVSIPTELWPLSPRPSRVTPRCNRSCKPPGVFEPAPECLLSCQRPLTRLHSHRSHPAPRSQSLQQRHWRQGRLRARCHPQRDEDHRPQVRCRPRSVCFHVSAH